ncbi:MAG TPA: hypothetical protein DIW77_17500 [Chromatiaceae bacterium]|nr:hypothetical protein [Chromatiaceae bacterium]
MAMVVEVGPSAVGVSAHLLRQGSSLREACRLSDEQVERVAILFEFAAILVLPLRALVLGLARRLFPSRAPRGSFAWQIRSGFVL